jgi:hypothetical protein
VLLIVEADGLASWSIVLAIKKDQRKPLNSSQSTKLTI